MIVKHNKAYNILVPSFLAISVLILILIDPQHSYEAALKGLDVWLHVVFPALLPFFIGAEVMIGLGVVDFISVLLQPVMYPLFRCPGNSSFVWAMSMTSGYPVGAKLISSFYADKKITRIEGQRMLAFCSTSGPLFMIGAVGIGMLKSITAGRILAISHYLSAVILGILFRFYGGSSPNSQSVLNSSLSLAFTKIKDRRQKDGRKIAELLGDSVRNSVNTLLSIGGFIILFSVVINMMNKIGVIEGIAQILTHTIPALRNNKDLLKGILSGFFEMTVGCRDISVISIPMEYKIVSTAFLIGWSGFSIHGQAASFLSSTKISFGLYFCTKLLHGILSSLCSLFIIRFFFNSNIALISYSDTSSPISWSKQISLSLNLFITVLIVLIFICLILYILRKAILLTRNRFKA